MIKLLKVKRGNNLLEINQYYFLKFKNECTTIKKHNKQYVMIIAHPMLEFLAVGNKKHFNDDEKINKFINE